MNILLYSHVALWTVHHAETVEIALKHLASGHKVYLLSCDGDLTSCPANAFHDEALCQRCREQTNYTLKRILENKVVDLRLSLENEGVTVPEFTCLEELAEFKLNNIPFGELVTSQLVDDYKDCFFSLDDKQQRISKLLNNSIALYKEAKYIIKNKKINKVYVWNGRRCSDGPICYAAKDEGVDFEVYISGGKRNTYLTLPAVKVHDFAANKALMEKLYSEGIQNIGVQAVEEEAKTFFRSNRYGGGDYAGYVHYAEGFTESADVQSGARRKIVIFPGSYWEYFRMSDYKGNVYPSHYEGIKTILNDERIYSKSDLIVRWHPNLKNCGESERKVIDNIIGGLNINSVHYPPESNVDSYKLIDIADVVVTFGSTIGVEANFYGKPSILLGRALYEEACYRPKCHEELVKLINADLPPLPKIGAIKYAFYFRNFGQNQFTYLRKIGSASFSYKNKPLQKPRMRSRIAKLLKFMVRYTSVRSILK
jgi:hypothetical protein